VNSTVFGLGVGRYASRSRALTSRALVSPPFGDLRAMYAAHLRLTGKLPNRIN